jgi:hypothetical protein
MGGPVGSPYHARMEFTMNHPSTRNRGGSGALMLILLLGVAIGLYLYFGNTSGNKSYVQTVVGAKKQGNELSIGIQAQQLAALISDYRMNHNGKAPASYQDMDIIPSSFNDQWGHPLRFKFDAEPARDAKDFLVTSDGPDGKADTEDDISQRVALQF